MMNIQFIEAPALSLDNKITVLAFRSRFSQTEKRRFYEAAKTNVDIQIYLDDLAAAETKGVVLTDPRTIAGVNGLAAASLLDGPERAPVILTAPIQSNELF